MVKKTFYVAKKQTRYFIKIKLLIFNKISDSHNFDKIISYSSYTLKINLFFLQHILHLGTIVLLTHFITINVKRKVKKSRN